MSYKIELSKEEFIEQMRNNWDIYSNEKLNTTKVISEFIVENKLSLKNFNSLKTMSKPNLKVEVISSLDTPLKNQSKNKIDTTSNDLSNDIIDTLNSLKEEIQGTQLNPFLRKQATKSLDSLLLRFKDNEQLNNVGFIGNGIVLIFTFLDVFIDIKTIPQKIKDFKEKKAKANATKSK